MRYGLDNADGVIRTLGCYAYTEEVGEKHAAPQYAITLGRDLSVGIRSFGYTLACVAKMIGHIAMRLFYYLSDNIERREWHKKQQEYNSDLALSYFLATFSERKDGLAPLAIFLGAHTLDTNFSGSDVAAWNLLKATGGLALKMGKGFLKGSVFNTIDDDVILAKGYQELYKYINKIKMDQKDIVVNY